MRKRISPENHMVWFLKNTFLNYISICLLTKVNLTPLLKPPCFQCQRSKVTCRSSAGFQTLELLFWPIPPRFGTFYGVEICRLARPIQDLEMLLRKPLLLLRYHGDVFGIIVMLKDPATIHLHRSHRWTEVFTLNATIGGPYSFFPLISHPNPTASCFYPHASQ